MTTSDERLIELEIKISHLEAGLETVQQQVYEHERLVARLETLIKLQAKRLAALTDDGPAIGPADEKPPHY